jgi:hypothetical protein
MKRLEPNHRHRGAVIAAALGLASSSLVATGCGLFDSSEVYAVGSLVHHAAPEPCAIETDESGVLTVPPDYPQPDDGKGLVFEAMRPGEATVRCGDTRTKIVVREAKRIELQRGDETQAPVKLGELYAPTVCVRAFDDAGALLSIGTLTDGITFETSEHLRSIRSHGMGLPGVNTTCLPLQHPEKAGEAQIRASWRGLTAQHTLQIVAP